MRNMKAPLPLIKERGLKTFVVMQQLAPSWQAPEFISANNFDGLVEGIAAQESVLGLKEAAQSAAAGDLDATLVALHEDSVLALKVGRVHFSSTTKAPAWRNLTANGGGRERVIAEGNRIAEAWENSGAAWVPKAGRTLAAFKALCTAAETKFKAHSIVEGLADIERGILWDKADYVWELSVQWYEVATATYEADTPQGYLIRTIPTTYYPNEAPGQLQFTEHYSPAPNQVKLVWHAARGEHFNLFARQPGSTVFTQILTNVTQTSWMGEGLTPGEWMFSGEARNAAGTGDMSVIITVPVSAAMVA